MNHPSNDTLLWCVIPGLLTGMPMPFIHPDRRMAGGGTLADYRDELSSLHSAGIRAVVSLLNIPSDATVFESAGFDFLCLPIPDGGAPTDAQADEFIQFVSQQHARGQAVAVHCEAGLGRTGTMLALYLISNGDDARNAIATIRVVEGSAVETTRQIGFLEQYAKKFPHSVEKSGDRT